ncbi:MAG: hypothetical protein ACRDL8_21975, partial [Solirubrobacteraceae bacterium]
MSATDPSAPGRTLTSTMGVVETHPVPTVILREYDKRLMLVTGRANPELAYKIADKLGVELSAANNRTFANG